jgi:hypothetical protein
MFNLKGLIAAALIAATPLQAQQAGPELLDFQEALTALGDPIELICASGMRAVVEERLRDPVAVTRRAAEFSADDQMMQQFYTVAFDKAAATDLFAQLQTAISATSGPELGEIGSDTTAAAVEVGIRQQFDQFGLSPNNIIDVTVFYLTFLWTAQEADHGMIRDVGLYGALREQVALAESRCFILGSKSEALPALRNTLIARSMFLASGMEVSGMTGEAEAFGAFVRDRFGLELQDLQLVGDAFQ